VTQKDETELQTAQKDENKDHDDKKGLDMMDAQKDHEELQRDSQRLWKGFKPFQDMLNLYYEVEQKIRNRQSKMEPEKRPKHLLSATTKRHKATMKVFVFPLCGGRTHTHTHTHTSEIPPPLPQ